MKHLDYLTQLEKDPDYQNAVKELEAHFLLGEAIIRARIQKGLSQAELAEMVGTKQANISRIESALANPTLKLINRIANVLDIEIQFIATTSTTSYHSIPAARLPAPNWPSRPVTTNSKSTQTIGNLR